MKRGLVFAGQGVQRKGMCMHLVQRSRRVAQVWERIKCCMMENYGIAIQEVVQANPTRISVHSDALDVTVVGARSCRGPSLSRPESYPRPAVVAHEGGVMQYSYLTQPCVLAAQMVALEALKEEYALSDDLHEFAAIAGHSLGEYTALCALGVFDIETALHLTYRRGLLMEQAVASSPRGTLCMYACNPSRAMLSEDKDKADDAFFVLVELIARSLRRSHSFLEAVNFNLYHEQYIVAGDVVAMAVLGKCLDPQFRAAHSGSDDSDAAWHLVQAALIDVGIDKQSGLLSSDVNGDKVVDYVSSGRRYGVRNAFRRFMRGPDDGYTPSLDELTHLTLEGDGRSGLKRKGWFIPLSVEVPFHSSRLRRCADAFLPMVRDALPDEATLRKLLSLDDTKAERPHWVTNLTGTTFEPLSAAWRQSALEVMAAPNIGEQTHRGRHSSTLLQTTFDEAAAAGSVRDMCAVVLAAQLCHPVLWIEVMDEMVMRHGCTSVVEVSPAHVLSEFFRRTSFTSGEGNTAITVHAQCYPADHVFHW